MSALFAFVGCSFALGGIVLGLYGHPTESGIYATAGAAWLILSELVERRKR